MEISKLLILNYLPYAKSTIIARALVSIDGLKPVQRRVLYTMNNLRLGDPSASTCKSVKIIGDTMGKYHPHGDSSIYEALVMMTNGYDAFNIPYIRSKGSMGKCYSKKLKYAAPRYTEAKLEKICSEMFDGINENAVDIIDNFDGTEKEPTLLPVKFPTILVNSSAGIAVGTSSNIPSFALKNVCQATIGVMRGTITKASELAPVLGVPEFTTGGKLHTSAASLEHLCETGCGSFAISGTVEVYSNKIIITEIPYCTSVEDILDAIDNEMKQGNFKGIKSVDDEIGLEGLRLSIGIKNGYNSRDVLQELYRLTDLRTKISFRTRIIVADRYREMGLMEVIDNWLSFRTTCIQRMYQFRLEKDSKKEHLLATWDFIKDDINNVVQMISKNTDSDAKNILMSQYGMDDLQAEYLLDMKIRSITTDRAAKALKELSETRERINEYTLITTSDDARKDIIEKELLEIIQKYARDRRTIESDELIEDDNKLPEQKISDETVSILFTKDGYVKRLVSLSDMSKTFSFTNGDCELGRWSLKNNEHLLVFDIHGAVHKVIADDIDSSRGKFVEKLYQKAGLEKAEEMLFVDVCGDYSGYFNLVYPNGRGTRVYYSKALGNRKSYKSIYDEVKPGQCFVTKHDKFFLITHRQKAAYCDITNLGVLTARTAFKVARISSGDWFEKLQPYSKVPNVELINLDKYNKDYTVSIGYDVLVKQ